MKTASSLAVLVISVIGGLSACEDRQPPEPAQTAPPRAEPQTLAEPEPQASREPGKAGAAPVTPGPPTSSTSAQPEDDGKEAREGEQATPPASAPDAPPRAQVAEPPVVTPPSQGEQLIEDAQRAGWEVNRDAEGNVILAPPRSQGVE